MFTVVFNCPFSIVRMNAFSGHCETSRMYVDNSGKVRRMGADPSRDSTAGAAPCPSGR